MLQEHNDIDNMYLSLLFDELGQALATSME